MVESFDLITTIVMVAIVFIGVVVWRRVKSGSKGSNPGQPGRTLFR